MNLLTVMLSPLKYFWDFYAISSTDEAAKRGISKFSVSLRMFIGLSLFPAMLTFFDYYNVYRSQEKAIEVLEPYSGASQYFVTHSGKVTRPTLRIKYIDEKGNQNIRNISLAGVSISTGSFSDLNQSCLSVHLVRVPHISTVIHKLSTCDGDVLYQTSLVNISRDNQIISDRRRLALILAIMSVVTFFLYPITNVFIKRN
jgi:hypothetical protein